MQRGGAISYRVSLKSDMDIKRRDPGGILEEPWKHPSGEEAL
jgi:hypothetical protein